MKVICVDDEKNGIINLEYYIKQHPEVTSAVYFNEPSKVIAYAQENEFDVAFLDIHMPEMLGTELALRLKALHPDIEIVYVTAHDDYHREAYNTGGRAYLLKPYNSEAIEEVFRFLRKMVPVKEVAQVVQKQLDKTKAPVFIQTFGNFDLWVDGKPVMFKTAKAKELLAVLVNHRGSVVTGVEVFGFLWPNKTYCKSTATYVRKVVQALKVQLQEIGCENLVTFSRNAFYINATAAVCDYYAVVEGDGAYLANYNGYYMAQYPWAEESIYIIEQNIKSFAARNGKEP